MRECDIFLQPEAREERDREDDTKGRDMGRETELRVESGELKEVWKLQVNQVVTYNKIIDEEIEDPIEH